MLLDKLKIDLVVSLKERNTLKSLVLRSLISEIKNTEISLRPQGKELTEEDCQKVLAREAKKRNESIEIFSQAKRVDLADKEKAELEILKEYLPQQLDLDAIKMIVNEVVQTNPSLQFGEIIKLVMQKTKGSADGKIVSSLVKERLG